MMRRQEEKRKQRCAVGKEKEKCVLIRRGKWIRRSKFHALLAASQKVNRMEVSSDSGEEPPVFSDSSDTDACEDITDDCSGCGATTAGQVRTRCTLCDNVKWHANCVTQMDQGSGRPGCGTSSSIAVFTPWLQSSYLLSEPLYFIFSSFCSLPT